MRKKVKEERTGRSRIKLLDRRFWLEKRVRLQMVFRSFYGISRTDADRLSNQAGMLFSFSTAKVPSFFWPRWERELDQLYWMGRPLQKEQNSRLQHLKLIGSYRGLRLMQGLPARGQRTHTNHRTVRRMFRPIIKKEVKKVKKK